MLLYCFQRVGIRPKSETRRRLLYTRAKLLIINMICETGQEGKTILIPLNQYGERDEIDLSSMRTSHEAMHLLVDRIALHDPHNSETSIVRNRHHVNSNFCDHHCRERCATSNHPSLLHPSASSRNQSPFITYSLHLILTQSYFPHASSLSAIFGIPAAT